MSHTSKSAGDTTTASGAIAGMDVSVTNKAGATTWSLGTTVSGVGLTLASSQTSYCYIWSSWKHDGCYFCSC